MKRKNKCFKDEYYESALLVVGAEPVFAKKYCLCGTANKKNQGGYCNKRHFCPRCAEYRAYKYWETFKHAYHSGNFFFVTFSYDGAMVAKGPDSWDEAHLHWDAIDSAIRKAFNEGKIRGGIVSEEMAVLNVLTGHVQAHAHAIIDADSFDEGLVEEMKASMTAYTDVHGESVGIQPTIRLNHIKEADFKRQLYYMFKPIDLVTPYSSTWNAIADANRTKVWRLNSALKDFFGWHTQLTQYRTVESEGKSEFKRNPRMMVKCFGTMHGKQKQYIGNKAKKKRSSKKKPTFKILQPSRARVESSATVTLPTNQNAM